MQKVTVFREAFDRKWNRRMTKSGLPGVKEETHPLSFYHLDSKDLFLSAASGKSTCLLSSVAATAKHTRWKTTDPQTFNSEKNDFIISFIVLSRETRLFLLVQENIQRHRVVENPKVKFGSKGILVSFLSSLILLQLRRRKEENKGMG